MTRPVVDGSATVSEFFQDVAEAMVSTGNHTVEVAVECDTQVAHFAIRLASISDCLETEVPE